MADGELVHWSDMLAVRDTVRDQGLSTRLKHYQREVLLGRGVHRMRWTFDPLQSPNANVNLEKLGIITDEHEVFSGGEFYLPNLPYATNNHLGGKPLEQKSIRSLVQGWPAEIEPRLPTKQPIYQLDRAAVGSMITMPASVSVSPFVVTAPCRGTDPTRTRATSRT